MSWYTSFCASSNSVQGTSDWSARAFRNTSSISWRMPCGMLIWKGESSEMKLIHMSSAIRKGRLPSFDSLTNATCEEQ